MLNLLLASLILSALYSSVSATEWAAVFLSAESKSALCSDFLQPNLPSSSQVLCDHMTIQYGGDLSPWKSHLGQAVNLTVMAYAQDDNAQAVLVKVNQDLVVSSNEFSHISVSVSGVTPYTAVYSNTLWSRVVNASGMSVQRDSCGQISQVSLPLTDPLTWSGTLPAVVIGTTSYTITPASTALVVHPFALQGTVCFASIWNAQTNQCEIAATL